MALLDSPLLPPFVYFPSLPLKSSNERNSVVIVESVSVPLSNLIGASPPTWPSDKIWFLKSISLILEICSKIIFSLRKIFWNWKSASCDNCNVLSFVSSSIIIRLPTFLMSDEILEKTEVSVVNLATSVAWEFSIIILSPSLDESLSVPFNTRKYNVCSGGVPLRTILSDTNLCVSFSPTSKSPVSNNIWFLSGSFNAEASSNVMNIVSSIWIPPNGLSFPNGFVARFKNKFLLCLDVGLVATFVTITCVRLLSFVPLTASRAVSALMIPPLSRFSTM